jgi:hypothetical protein
MLAHPPGAEDQVGLGIRLTAAMQSGPRFAVPHDVRQFHLKCSRENLIDWTAHVACKGLTQRTLSHRMRLGFGKGLGAPGVCGEGLVAIFLD